MTRRNNANELGSKTVIEFEYPSHEEIAAMVREAQLMRAQAIRATFRWLRAVFTGRRASAPAAGSATAKA